MKYVITASTDAEILEKEEVENDKLVKTALSRISAMMLFSELVTKDCKIEIEFRQESEEE